MVKNLLALALIAVAFTMASSTGAEAYWHHWGYYHHWGYWHRPWGWHHWGYWHRPWGWHHWGYWHRRYW
jgi:hypothetical protein